MELSGNGLPFYRKTILPNRSLTAHGAAIVLGGAVLATAIMSVGLLSLGAWPVVPFVLGALAAVGAMLYDAALHRDDFELLIIDDDNFHVLRRCGRQHSWHRFQRYWACIYFEPPERLRPVRLYVRSHGRALEIGAQLDEPRRRLLAREIGSVLGRPVGGA